MKCRWMVVAVALAQVSWAQAALPWNSLDGLSAKAKSSVEINLDSNSLQLASGLMRKGDDKEKDTQTANLISTLKGITVRAYEFAAADQYDKTLLRSFSEQLQGQGWSKMIDVKGGNESFELYSKMEQGKSAGFAMIAAEPKELAVIHINGPIDFSQLGNLQGQFGIPKIPGPVKPPTQRNPRNRQRKQ